MFSCKNDTQMSDPQEENIIKVTDITQIGDYEDHLAMDLASTTEGMEKEIYTLKTKVAQNPQNILDLSKLASLLDQKFDLTGNVEFLNESVRFQESAVKYTVIKPESAQRSLAQSYIKQHRFKAADSIIKRLSKEYQSNETKFIMFDIAMELGSYERAEKLLDELRNDRDYNYLIRAAKWNDHQGKLDNTIMYMEQALELANQSGNKAWMLWSNSNIADYYGHDGQIAKSYAHFRNTLELDKGNSYALKGIAWIAYSNDKQPQEAMEIIQRLAEKSPKPDYDLMMSEIAEFMGDEKHRTALWNKFIDKAGKSNYGDMYNAYLIEELASGTSDQKKRAVEIAKKEIENRATPEIYDLLGYALLMNEQESAALQNHQNYVIGKTFEPVAQMHTAAIYRANAMNKEADALVAALMEASYELGPVTLKKIEKI